MRNEVEQKKKNIVYMGGILSLLAVGQQLESRIVSADVAPGEASVAKALPSLGSSASKETLTRSNAELLFIVRC